MKKIFSSLSVFLLFMFSTLSANAQLTGTKNIPGDYSTVIAAINDLNAQGVGAGGVTFQVAANYTETFSSIGAINVSGSAANPIIFTKTGVGNNPLITAPTGGGGGTDGIIILEGADYVTFNQIDLQENPLNVGSGAMMEWGYALLKRNSSAPVDGCQNNTIQNCVVTLNKTHTGSIGINIANHTRFSTSALTISDPSDANSFNKVYGNTIQNAYNGVSLLGYNAPAPYSLYDQNNEIGGTTIAAGNLIQNFGGTITASAGVSGRYQNNLSVRYNTINSGSTATPSGNIYGIFHDTGVNSNFTAANNTITLSQLNCSGLFGINWTGITGTGTINISDNVLQNWSFTGSTASNVYFLYNNSAHGGILNIERNSILNNTNLNTNGEMIGIDISASYLATSVINVDSNTINNFSRAVPRGGTMYGFFDGGASFSGAVENITNNTFSNITNTGNSNVVALQSSNGSTVRGPNVNMTGNIVSNVFGGADEYTAGIHFNCGGTANVVANNTVTNVSGTWAPIYGIEISVTSLSAANTRQISGNVVSGITTTIGGQVFGMEISGTASTNTSIFSNRIYNITANHATGIAHGIKIVSGSATNIYNNFVSDIKAPITSNINAVIGISINAGNTGCFYNTVFLNASSSSGFFGSSAFFLASSQPIQLRNNIGVNMSTPSGGARSIALWINGSMNSAYSTSSNNNDFYAGTPSTSNLIYLNGVNLVQTISEFRSIVAPRDDASFSEMPPFLNISSVPYDLRLDPNIATMCESGGSTVSSPVSVTTDFDGTARFPNPGYPQNPSYPATAPDVGADEYAGIPIDITPPSITYTTLINTGSTLNRTLTATITDPAGIPSARLYFKKSTNPSYQFDASPIIAGNSYTFTINNAALGGVVPGDIIQYYVAAQDSNNNMRTMPTGGSGINPPGTTPPPSINSYSVTNTALNGDYTVGTVAFNRATGLNLSLEKFTRTELKDVETGGQVEEYWALAQDGKLYDGPQVYNPPSSETGDYSAVYATISAAVNDLNSRGVSGPTRFLLTDASYSEGAAVTIDINNEFITTPTNTVTFKPAPSVNTEITITTFGGASFAVADNYIIFDGSNTDGGSTRNMTITNSGNALNSGVFTVTGGNCAIKNLNARVIIHDRGFGITFSGAGNALVTNCGVTRCRTGIQASGVNNIIITENDIGGMDSLNTVGQIGISIQNTTNYTIDNNTISGMTRWTRFISINGIFIDNSSTSGMISRNTINNIKNQGVDLKGGGANGIQLATNTAASNITIVNNSISDIYSRGDDGGPEDGSNGIYIDNGGGYKIYYNSIHLFGIVTNDNVSAHIVNAGISIYGVTGTGNLDIRNNIIVNRQFFAVPGVDKKSYAIYCVPSSSVFSNIDYNDYFVTGPDAILGYLSSDRTTIEQWRTATGKDASSITMDPDYLSASDLLPMNNFLNGSGIPISGITEDIFGGPRSDAIPEGPSDMGAYEKNGGTSSVLQILTINAGGVPFEFYVGGRILGRITVNGYTGTPFNIAWMSFPGEAPPNPPPGSQYAIGYDSIWISGGTFNAASYDIQLYSPKNSLFNIVDTNKIIVAKTNNEGATWTSYPGTYIPGYPSGFAQATGLTSFSIFSLTSSDAPLPVELASFTSNVNRNIVKLNWATSEEQNNAGFDIERKPIDSETWNKVGNVGGSGNSTQQKQYSFNDNVNTGNYNYRLKQIDFNGNFQYFDLSGEVIVGVPGDFKLSQNYPNPFNPTTKIDYDLPVDSKVNLKIYDMLGREAANLVNNDLQKAGYYTVQMNGVNMASGTYFFRIIAQGSNGKDFVMTKKMLLVK